MSALLEQVHFAGHLVLQQSEVVDDAVLGRHAPISGGVPEERRRSLAVDLTLARHLEHEFPRRTGTEQIALRTLVGERLIEGDHRELEADGSSAQTDAWAVLIRNRLGSFRQFDAAARAREAEEGSR